MGGRTRRRILQGREVADARGGYVAKPRGVSTGRHHLLAGFYLRLKGRKMLFQRRRCTNSGEDNHNADLKSILSTRKIKRKQRQNEKREKIRFYIYTKRTRRKGAFVLKPKSKQELLDVALKPTRARSQKWLSLFIFLLYQWQPG